MDESEVAEMESWLKTQEQYVEPKTTTSKPTTKTVDDLLQ
jgi:hypothetical protein